VRMWGDPESFCWVLYSRFAGKGGFDGRSSYLNADLVTCQSGYMPVLHNQDMFQL
jgi:hypothetical protein